MIQSIGYRYDEAMLKHIKKLELKTTAFGGYDKKDVYDKIRDLITAGRNVCEEVYEEALAAMDINELSAAPEEFSSEEDLQEKVSDEQELTTADRELLNATQQLEEELTAAEEELSLISEKLSKRESDLAKANKEIEQLKQKLSNYSENEESLDQAKEILYEARLEAKRIVAAGKEKSDEEVLLGRAKRRSEEEEAKQRLVDIKEKTENVEERCRKLQDYLLGGKELQKQLEDYALSFPIDQEDDVVQTEEDTKKD